jgi:hypothetical protein
MHCCISTAIMITRVSHNVICTMPIFLKFEARSQSQYVFMCHQQNTGQDQNINMVNKAFKNVEKSKYMRTLRNHLL